MGRRTAREKRTLGLWTASWLGAFLLVGVLRVGDLSVQWPVLLVPVLWALVAARPRRGGPAPHRARHPRPAPARTDTVERSFLRDLPEERRRPWREPG